MRGLLLVCALANTARADHCQDLLDQYNQHPDDAGNDQVLLDAGACFQNAKALGAATMAYELILKYYPSSKLAPRAMYEGARIYERIAMFDKAAGRYEDYGKRYAGEQDARDAMARAATLRGAIGDDQKRREDTRFFVRTWGAKAPKLAADAMYAAADSPEDLREVIKTYGGKLDPDKLASAYGRIGDALWAKSCPVSPIDGLCVKIARDATQSCDPSQPRFVAVARTTALRGEALAAYDQAIAAYGSGNDPIARHVAAMAKVVRADDGFERLLENQFPTGLDFSANKDASKKKFDDWLAAETKQSQALTKQYEDVLTMKDASSSIAAAARIGQLTHAFARALATAEIPKDVRTGNFAKDKQQAFCDAMKQASEPLLSRSASAFEVCVDKAAQLGVYDRWVGLCHAEGRSVDAKKFPPREVVPALAIAFTAVPEPGKKPAAGSPEAQSNQGVQLWNQGKHDDAVAVWNAALKANGKLFAARYGMAIAQYEQLRALAPKDPKRRAVAADLEFNAANALALDPSPLPFALLAAEAADIGKPALARYYLDRARELDDKLVAAHLAAAYVAARAEHWTEAYASAERAVKLAPDADDALRVGGIVAAHVGKLDSARDRLARLTAQPYEVVVARAIAARATGDRVAAERLYQQAIQLDPGRAEAYYDLAIFHERYASPLQPAKAEDEYKKAASLDPSLPRPRP